MKIYSLFRLLRYEDVIAGHCEFLETAELAIRSLLYLKDHGEAAIQEGLEGLHFGEVDCKAADSKMGGYLADALIWAEKLLTFRGNDPRAHRIASPVLWQCGKLLPACRSAILASAEGISPEFVKSLLNDLSNSTTIEMELARDILGRVKVENLKVPRCSLDLPTPNLDKFL